MKTFAPGERVVAINTGLSAHLRAFAAWESSSSGLLPPHLPTDARGVVPQKTEFPAIRILYSQTPRLALTLGAENDFIRCHTAMRIPMDQDQQMTGLSEARDRGAFSSRNTSKGALIDEAHAVFTAIHGGLSVGDARIAIREGVVLRKASFETRRKILDLLTHRYFWPGGEWCVEALGRASVSGARSPEFLSLAYLYFALRDRFTFEAMAGLVWDRWQNRSTSITHADMLQFLEGHSADEPQVKRWKESTRAKLAHSVLAALRDFGLLCGTQVKQIQKPVISPETTFHLVCILLAEGHDGRALVEARDWRLFLWSESEVAKAMGELAQLRWIRFEKSGRTVMLELLRQPGENP